MKGGNAASYYHSMVIQFCLIVARASLIADKSLLLSFANDAEDVTVKQPRRWLLSGLRAWQVTLSSAFYRFLQ